MNWIAIPIVAVAGLRFVITLVNFITQPVLRKQEISFLQKISILIPARNEENRIGLLLRSIAGMKKKPYEVIVYDDQSSDATASVVASFQQKLENVKMISGGDVPAGWVGKSFACSQLASRAHGDYLLFLDADIEVHDSFLESLQAEAVQKKLSLLSLFPSQKIFSAGEWATVPLMNYLLLTLLPLRMVFTTKSDSAAAANGQCMFFEAANYHKFQWHTQSRNTVLEDVQIAKKIKGAGLKTEVLLGGDFVECRMYESLSDAITGFRKNLIPLFGGSIPGFLIYLLLTFFGFIYLVATKQWESVIIFSVLVLAMKIMTSILSGQSIFKNILFHIPQQLLFIFIGSLSSADHLTKKTVWKGRVIRS